MDRLLLSADFLDSDFLLKQWIGCGGDSNHQPVYLQISSSTPKAHCPFKFNACWLEHIELVELLKDSWVVFDALSEVSPASQFVANLKRIKDISIKLSLKKKAQDIKDLVDIESDMKRYYDRTIIGFISEEDKLSLIELESCKISISCFREKEARQKSRALWLICGDDNTPFFHKFVAHTKNLNTIWKILILEI